jgi:putative FmdB family regulatory protein
VDELPIYEYRCTACGHQFEVNQRMTDDPVRDCEVCSGEVRRVLYAPAIHFKGTGFHNTDYGTRKRPKESEVAASGAGASSTDGSGSGDGGSAAGDAGGAKKVKEATPAATAARTTGP